MKKSMVVFVVALTVLVSTILWVTSSISGIDSVDLGQIGIIVLLLGFAVYVGIKRIKSEKRGEPAEDEFSKQILLKTAAYSFYISLYLWIVILYLKDKIQMDIEEWIGTGVLGMAVTFALCYILFSIRGIRN